MRRLYHCTDGEDDHEKICESVDDSGKKECRRLVYTIRLGLVGNFPVVLRGSMTC